MPQSKKKTGKPFVIFLLCSIAAANAFISGSPDNERETFLDQERRYQTHARNILDRNIARRITEGDSDSVLDNLFDRRSFRTGPLDRKSGSDSARRETPLERRSITNPEDSRRLRRETLSSKASAPRTLGKRSIIANPEDSRRLRDSSRLEMPSSRASAPRTVTDTLRRERSEDSRRLNIRNNFRLDRTEPSEPTGTIMERSEQLDRLNIRNDVRFERRLVSEPRSLSEILRRDRSERNDENSRRLERSDEKSRRLNIRNKRGERSDENSRHAEIDEERSRRLNIRNDIRKQVSEPRTLTNIVRENRAERRTRSVEDSRRQERAEVKERSDENSNNIRFDRRQVSEPRTFTNILRENRAERRVGRSVEDSRRQERAEVKDEYSRRLNIRSNTRQVSELRTLTNILRQDRAERRERSDESSERLTSRRQASEPSSLRQERSDDDSIRQDIRSDTVRDQERSEQSRRRNIRNRSGRTESRRVSEMRTSNVLRLKRSDDLSERRNIRNRVRRSDQERAERRERSLERLNIRTTSRSYSEHPTASDVLRALPTRASERSDETFRRLRRVSLTSERRERSIEISRRDSDSERSMDTVSRRFDIRNLREIDGKVSETTSGRSERREEPKREFRTLRTLERLEKEELSRDRFLKESLSSRALPAFEEGKVSHTEVWANTVKIILAMYLIGQIFVDSKKGKFRFQNVVNTLQMKKVQ